jgi:glycosidase
MKKLSVVLMSCISFLNFAQTIEVSPSFPTINDEVTIIYDATQGNAALVGVAQIYAHTGVITSTSTSPTNWMFTKGTWGTADPLVAMTPLGNNRHSITFNISDFYAFPQGTIVKDMAFVFRNAAGTIVGRSQDGSDIYYPVYPDNGELFARIFTPNTSILVDENDQFQVEAESNMNATLTLFDNGVELVQNNNTTQLNYTITAGSSGNHLVELVADNGSFVKRDTIYYTVNPPINVLDAPVGTQNGINYISETSVILQLYAPDKNNIYVIGDFNNWIANADYHMNRATDNATWWIEISGLTPNQKYGYQYFIDGELKLADPLSALVLDPNSDGSISALTYPDRHPYPVGKTTGFVTVIQPGAPAFNWQHDDFVAPENKDLIIYEVLVRDFVGRRNYLTIIDTLDYLERLGINAIELMPVGEFENNESWGYNPSFHMALDKYYGTPEHFKMFVDACHSRGIAVILDIALNHTFGQSPLVNMYWDAANNRPAANNPWFNAICPHEPYCWGYDMNHEVQATKDYIDRINKFWMDEYHLDGFRFDYTKGFVNNGNGYSDLRISILKRMADKIWESHPNAYVILEHWADNNEERQLSDYGMMMWGNMTYNYHQANMGYPSNSDLSYGIHTSRGWNDPHLITYAESHDEERLMYESITYGNSGNANHDVKDLYVALKRAQASAVILLTTPGPKMIWQFGELGYDISIDDPCRVCNKPILWNYQQNTSRKQLYDIYAATLNLRKNYATFRTLNFEHSLTGAVKRLKLNDASMNAIVLANFAVVDQTANPTFHNTGWWYEYFTGDSINVTNTNGTLSLKPGEYRIYTSNRLTQPTITETNSLQDLSKEEFLIQIFPNPTSDFLNVSFTNELNSKVDYIILNEKGQVVKEIKNQSVNSGENSKMIDVSNLKSGAYHLLIKTQNGFSNKEFLKM